MDDPNADAAALIWDQARQQLAQQNADLDLLRTRAVAMLSVAALVARLFGTRLPQGHAHSRTLAFVIAALVLFAASVILAELVAAPRRKRDFKFNRSSCSALMQATLCQLTLPATSLPGPRWPGLTMPDR